MDTQTKTETPTGSARFRRVWVDTEFDREVAAIDDDVLLYNRVQERIRRYLRASSAAWRDADEQEARYAILVQPDLLTEAEDAVKETNTSLQQTVEELKNNHSSWLFLGVLSLVLIFHLASEGVLNYSVLPQLVTVGGFWGGVALSLTAALAPLILERVFGSTMGHEPWDAHGQAKGWRRVFLWCLAVLNCVSIFFVAACRAIAAALAANPDTFTLTPQQQLLVDNALILLSFTIALNAGVFALYVHTEGTQYFRRRKLEKKDLRRIQKQKRLLDDHFTQVKQHAARATVRSQNLKKEGDLMEAEFQAQRDLALEARIAKIKTRKDPRAITTLAEQIMFADYMLGPAPEEDPLGEEGAFGGGDAPRASRAAA